ncbi:MAG: hypothetical protein AAFY59_01250, partial [Pseudomonadota bacterium]
MVDGTDDSRQEAAGATPVYALDLSRDGISLLDSRDRSVWRCLDTVPLQVGTLSRNLARLHARTGYAEGEESPVEVWLPTAEVQVEAVDLERWETPEEAVFAVFGATSAYPPETLAYDFAPAREDGLVPVAAVPTAVLYEAQGFLGAHGFRPIGYTTAEEPEGFGQMPDFMLSPLAAEEPAPGPAAAAATPIPKPAFAPLPVTEPAPPRPANRREPPPRWLLPTAGAAAALVLIGLGLSYAPALLGPADTRGLPGAEAQSMTALFPLARAEDGISVKVTGAEREGGERRLRDEDVLGIGNFHGDTVFRAGEREE